MDLRKIFFDGFKLNSQIQDKRNQLSIRRIRTISVEETLHSDWIGIELSLASVAKSKTRINYVISWNNKHTTGARHDSIVVLTLALVVGGPGIKIVQRSVVCMEFKNKWISIVTLWELVFS